MFSSLHLAMPRPHGQSAGTVQLTAGELIRGHAGSNLCNARAAEVWKKIPNQSLALFGHTMDMVECSKQLTHEGFRTCLHGAHCKRMMQHDATN